MQCNIYLNSHLQLHNKLTAKNNKHWFLTQFLRVSYLGAVKLGGSDWVSHEVAVRPSAGLQPLESFTGARGCAAKTVRSHGCWQDASFLTEEGRPCCLTTQASPQGYLSVLTTWLVVSPRGINTRKGVGNYEVVPTVAQYFTHFCFFICSSEVSL